MNRLVCLFIFCLPVTLSGCGPATTKKAALLDNVELNAEQICSLVAGNSLILSSYDFSGTIYFDESGFLSGVDNLDQLDVGKWDVNDQNQLCLKFRLWYYGDIKCYTVFNNPTADKLTFFTPNGAAYYTAMMVKSDPSALAKQLNKTAQAKSVRKEIASKQNPRPTSSTDEESSQTSKKISISESTENDSGQTVKRLAGNCPGCNMAGIDLKEASLVKANLQGADLSGADLRYANLRRANLNAANLENARLNHANLPGADLSNANFKNVYFSGANLLLANFTDADIIGTIFTNANLEKTIGLTSKP